VTDGPTRTQLALWAAAAVAIALLGARYLRSSEAVQPPPAAGTAPAAVQVTERRAAPATVHVAGAVRRPGVYRLQPGDRVDDAVRRAGGATAKADLGAVNLAAKIEDGRQVLVPERVPAVQAGAGVGEAGPAGAAPGAPGTPLDLNTATLEQLDTLPGVGPATAEKILAYRDEHGGFGSVDELGRVPGIGDKRLATLREQVRV
jgi:competence protein ComEA